MWALRITCLAVFAISAAGAVWATLELSLPRTRSRFGAGAVVLARRVAAVKLTGIALLVIVSAGGITH